ncbi:MAG: hypothetical protein SYC29_00015 [Planctomycetota bacterium]|nr:hypothetical protein [Planctomycetota bacterium]
MKAKSSRERNVFIGILGLALAALSVDRVFLGSGATGPAEASAAAEAYAVDASPDAADLEPVEDADEPRPLTSVLADRINTFGRADAQPISELPDVFGTPTSWAGDEASGETGARPTSPAQAFQADHRLTAVMLSQSNPGAVVDGAFLKIGQALDGFALTSVNERSAVFERDGERAELALDPPSQAP